MYSGASNTTPCTCDNTGTTSTNCDYCNSDGYVSTSTIQGAEVYYFYYNHHPYHDEELGIEPLPFRRGPEFYKFNLVREYQEHLFRLILGGIFNVYQGAFNRRQAFSKSGFVGSAAKRRKGVQ